MRVRPSPTNCLDEGYWTNKTLYCCFIAKIFLAVNHASKAASYPCCSLRDISKHAVSLIVNMLGRGLIFLPDL